jgi:hypothetical protein
VTEETHHPSEGSPDPSPWPGVPNGAPVADMTDAQLVELASAQAYQTAGQTGIGSGSTSWYRAANGFRAQAELVRRLTGQLVESSRQTAESAKRLEDHTVRLKFLTWVLVALTVALLVIGIVTIYSK